MSARRARAARRSADVLLDEVYADVPALACKGLCQASCTAQIRFGVGEAARMRAAHGGPLPQSDDAYGAAPCPLLTAAGACSIHAARPLICRLWGTVEGMRCPHGCEPEEVVTIGRARELLAAVGGRGVDQGDTMARRWWAQPRNRWAALRGALPQEPPA